jgi:hypothetical protein
LVRDFPGAPLQFRYSGWRRSWLHALEIVARRSAASGVGFFQKKSYGGVEMHDVSRCSLMRVLLPDDFEYVETL